MYVPVPKAYKAPQFIEELVALLTEQGTVSLECKVVGVPTPTLKWFKASMLPNRLFSIFIQCLVILPLTLVILRK